MPGTPVVGSLVAQLAFWILVVLGTLNGTLKKAGTVVFVLLWLAGYVGLPRLAWLRNPGKRWLRWVMGVPFCLVLLLPILGLLAGAHG